MTQPDGSVPTFPACPVCGADGAHREWREVYVNTPERRRPPLIESRSTPGKYATMVRGVVCTRCGNVMLFANPQEL